MMCLYLFHFISLVFLLCVLCVSVVSSSFLGVLGVFCGLLRHFVFPLLDELVDVLIVRPQAGGTAQLLQSLGQPAALASSSPRATRARAEEGK